MLRCVPVYCVLEGFAPAESVLISRVKTLVAIRLTTSVADITFCSNFGVSFPYFYKSISVVLPCLRVSYFSNFYRSGPTVVRYGFFSRFTALEPYLDHYKPQTYN
jgi:hypothetical protein